MATDEQVKQLRLHAVNDITRDVARGDVLLTHDQVDEIGEETINWMRARLGVKMARTDRGLECLARRYIAVTESDVGTCDALEWAALSIKPFVLADGIDRDDVLERALAKAGHDSIHIEER